MKELNELINNWRKYYINHRKSLIDSLSEGEFNAFLLGIEYGALYSDNMEYYSKVTALIDKYKDELK